MARSSFQKLKLLHVRNYLLQNSDEEHPITVNQMIQYLESNGIAAERKSIYDDIEALRTFGMDIEECKRGRVFGYYVASRTFELPELKLLVDSVQSSKFITHKKTASLIKKIETLASVHSAQLLHRQVFVKNRIKTMNESIYYNVDEIHNGISNNRKIRFLYFEYNVAKERQYRHGGAYYVVSPFAMTWDDENYYLWPMTLRLESSSTTAWTRWRRSPRWMRSGTVRRSIRRWTWRSTPAKPSVCSPAKRSRYRCGLKITW